MKIRDAKLEGLPCAKMAASYRKGSFFMFIRRFAMTLLSICCLAAPTTAWANPATSRIDVSELGNGIVKVQHDPAQQLNEKIKISKDNQHFYYSVKSNNRFPLQLGDGKYTISVLQYVADNKYRLVENKEVNLTASSQQAVFLQPIQMIYWNESTNLLRTTCWKGQPSGCMTRQATRS